MGRKVGGGLLLLVGAGLGLFFCAMVFNHGWNEGLIQLRRLEGPQLMFGAGALAFLVAGLLVLLRPAGDDA